ncbi:PREDICTED: uncharacterized protein LOC104789443 [Camelina sativa]|uniref:Uncharacterized protein LOC104789443 n=1 Tax=Camelina sativa TaxID=90675 RepID=A0ABM0ZBU6_CAMSA|nr:PREDICTED: uncharacterized protein LOC104789443 [Camelina sativa]
MLQQPNLLLARVFKAKYFPKTSILNASFNTNASYAWKSISQGTKLISHGLQYVVGNGEQIEVWNGQWLPLSPPRPARGIGKNLYPHLKVSNLLYQGSWNEELLSCIIDSNDIPRIKIIRPSITKAHDVISWIHTKDGVYTVKSGYKVERKISKDTYLTVDTTHSDVTARVFSKLWNQNSPPKIKHFWWRCLHNALPTAENLKKKRVLRDDTCQRCGETTESISHLSFQCRISSEVWHHSLNLTGSGYHK